MRRATRLLLAGLFALLVALPVGTVPAASADTAGAVAVAQPPTATPTPTAPAGPQLDPAQQPGMSRQKLVIGVFAAALLGIVIVGRRSVNKHRKKV